MQELSRPDCEPHGSGAAWRQPPICPNHWTQDGTEMLLGQLSCQGGTGSRGPAWSWWVTGAIHDTARRSCGCDDDCSKPGSASS